MIRNYAFDTSDFGVIDIEGIDWPIEVIAASQLHQHLRNDQIIGQWIDEAFPILGNACPSTPLRKRVFIHELRKLGVQL